jgi:general secretion pathway protein K
LSAPVLNTPELSAARKAARKRRKKRVDERGVALIMVLGAITVLTVFLTQLQQETAGELSSAVSERDVLIAEYHARSSINLTRLLIATGPKIEAAVGPMLALIGGKGMQIPVWEFSEMVLGPFNAPSAGGQAFGGISLDASTAKGLGLTGTRGYFEYPVVVDEDSKINVNVASHGSIADDLQTGAALLGLMSGQQYDTMFEQRDSDNQFSDRQTICGALVDWVDQDEEGFTCDFRTNAQFRNGAEDNIYQSLGLPYKRKNAAFDSLDELRLVRGVGDDFWSTFVDPDPENPRKRVLTVWGQGAVNVNGANAQTLLALLCEPDVLTEESTLCKDPIQATSFLSGVSLAKSFLPGVPLFPSPSAFINTLQKATAAADPSKAAAAPAAGGGSPIDSLFQMLQLKPVVFKAPGEFKKRITTRSKIFSIYAVGVVPGYRREARVKVHAVVDFRQASKIGQQQTSIFGSTPGAPSSTGNNQPTTQATSDAIAAQSATSPAGQMIYWRVE